MTRAEALHHIAAETGGIVRYGRSLRYDYDKGGHVVGDPTEVGVRAGDWYVTGEPGSLMLSWVGSIERAPCGGTPTVLTADDAIAVIREPHRWREVQARWEAQP